MATLERILHSARIATNSRHLRIGNFYLPFWPVAVFVIISALALSTFAAFVLPQSSQALYATIAQASVTVNVRAPVLMHAYAYNESSALFDIPMNSSYMLNLPGGSSFMFSISMDNLANRPLNITEANIVKEYPSRQYEYQVPRSVYVLGGNYSAYSYQSCPNKANGVAAMELNASYQKILDGLYNGSIKQGWYWYVPNGLKSPASRGVCGWIGPSNAYIPFDNSDTFYYWRGQGTPTGGSQSMPIFPQSSFFALQPSSNATFVFGIVMPPTYNGNVSVGAVAIASAATPPADTATQK